MAADSPRNDVAWSLASVHATMSRLDTGADPAELIEALARLRELRDELTGWEPTLIHAARARGASWAQLAPALGVASRQAAERRYLRLKPNEGDPAMTGEQRVQAARDERASERALADWARDNAANLRALAGQVAALDGLDDPTKASVQRIHDALGKDDTTALLDPLTRAGEGLGQDHPRLARLISDLGEQATAVRHAIQRRTGARRPAAQPSEEEG
ncbi:hypothetical protein [Kribbella catacumbae]|uniref:hypothetical protein n=1 Tax=Kribbella catacumbae TaxID=460086 RepID=UPI00037C10ED|nr:hypothetical protein [Kribbella catacumbae]